MPRDRSPATVVIVATVPRNTTESTFATLSTAARGAAVTWAMDGESLERLATHDHDAGWALLLDADATASRQELRRRLAAAGRTTARPDAVVFAPGVAAAHRDLLVAAGAGVAVVDRFDDAPRGTRRPAPEGWKCRSVLWGLWEVETGLAPAGGLGRFLPWGGWSPAGSLVVETVDLSGDARAAGDKLARTVARHSGGRSSVRSVTLGALGGILGQGAAAGTGSVLKAA